MTELTTSDARQGRAMAALTPKQRAFVNAYFEAPRAHGSGTWAVRAAGYGTPTSSRFSLASMAHQLLMDPKVQVAIAEVSQSYLTALGPLAVRALKKVLNNPKHPAFSKALGIVTDRVSPVQSTALVKIEHDVSPAMHDTAQIMARIAELSSRFAIKGPVVVDGEVVKREEAA